MQQKGAKAASMSAKCNISQHRQLNSELVKAIQVRENISSERMQLQGDTLQLQGGKCQLNASSMQRKPVKASQR
jgi:hypothetical protein